MENQHRRCGIYRLDEALISEETMIYNDVAPTALLKKRRALPRRNVSSGQSTASQESTSFPSLPSV
jgi:hypothetical protein